MPINFIKIFEHFFLFFGGEALQPEVLPQVLLPNIPVENNDRFYVRILEFMSGFMLKF